MLSCTKDYTCKWSELSIPVNVIVSVAEYSHPKLSPQQVDTPQLLQGRGIVRGAGWGRGGAGVGPGWGRGGAGVGAGGKGYCRDIFQV